MKKETVVVEAKTKGTQKSSKELMGMSTTLGRLGPAAAVATAALGALTAATIAAAAAAQALGSDIVNTIDEINTFAASSGLAAETVAGLRLAASATGKELKDLIPTEFAKKINDANAGSTKLAEVFAEVGVGAEMLERANADEILGQVVDGLAGVESAGKRAGIASELLGEAGKQMLSAFGDRADLDAFVETAGMYGQYTGPEAAEAAAAWQRANAALSLAIDEAKVQLIPFVKAAGNLAFSVAPYLIGGIQGIVDKANVMARVFKSIANGEIPDTTDILDSLNLSMARNVERGKLVSEATEKARKQLEKLTAELDKSLAPIDSASSGLKSHQVRLQDHTKATREDTEAQQERLEVLRDLAGRTQAALMETAGLQGNDVGLLQLQGEAEIGAIDDQIARLETYRGEVEGVSELIDALGEQRVAAIESYEERIAKALDKELEGIEQVEEATERKNRLTLEGGLHVAGALADTTRAVTDMVVSNLDLQTEEGRKAALTAFRIDQGARASQAIVSTLTGIARQPADLPYPAALITQGLIAASGAATVGAIIAEPPPSFHDGFRSTDFSPGRDERLVNIRDGELVTTAQGIQEMVTNANAGSMRSGPQTVIIAQNHKAVGAGLEQQIQRRGTTLNRELARSEGRRSIGRRKR